MSVLAADAVQALLSTAQLGRSLELRAVTGSTNDDARLAASRGAPDGHTIVADAQTAGRGSRGRDWVSPPGTDLYLSIVARLTVPLASLPPLTLAVGLAAAEALEAFLPSGQRALVKWPNDLWVGDRKLAGILVEGASIGERAEPLVIGIGVNVNRREFPSGLPATSLAREAGSDIAREPVLAALLNRLEPWLARFEREGAAPVVEALAGRLAFVGKRVRCDDVEGVLSGVAASGALLLATDAGLRECVSGTLRACEPDPEAPA